VTSYCYCSANDVAAAAASAAAAPYLFWAFCWDKKSGHNKEVAVTGLPL